MTSNRKSPIWPYLVVLAGLFLLSVTAPRDWQTRPPNRREPTNGLSSFQPAPRPHKPAVVLRAQTRDSQGRLGIAPLRIEPPPHPRQGTVFETSAATSLLVAGDAAPPADRETESTEDTTAEATTTEEAAGGGSLLTPDSRSFVSLEDQHSSDTTDDDLVLEEPIDRTQEVEEDVAPTPNYENWPLPVALIERLKRLAQHDGGRAWATDVRLLIDRLREVRVDDPAATDLLLELRSKTAAADRVRLDAGTERELERAQLDLVRRLDLWEQAAVASRRQLVFQTGPSVDATMLRALGEVVDLMEAAPVGNTWRDYLLLDRLRQLARDTSDDSAAERRRAAQMVLARMTDPRLSAAQRELLGRAALADLKVRLRVWVVEPLGVGELLHTVEAYEQARVASLGQTLAKQSVVLVESPDPAEQRLGGELQRHYRNANVRLVVTRTLVDRLLPSIAPAADPVNDTIVGVPTRGVSTTSSKLAVRLFPADDQIRVGLEASGVVDSQTASTSGPVTLHSTGESTYFVGKLVVIDHQGLRVGSAMAEAESRSRLAGLETNFDGIPLVGNLVRGYALNEHKEKQAQAQHEVEAKVASRASARFDAEVNARLSQAEADFRRRVLAPIARLNLNPTAVQLTTTEDRITARLRLAGDDQAGAHTPRPLALSNSLASLQIHESAINNALDRLQLAGRTFTLPELHQWVTQRLDRAGAAMPEDLPENVVVTFAANDPVRVRFIEGRVEVTVAIAELDDSRRVWYDFQITVYYEPRREGLRLEFFRNGPIELSGEAYAGRAAIGLRGIFAKVFSLRRTLTFEPAINPQNAALATLEYSSAIVDNGWISVTVADRSGSDVNR